MWQTKQPASNRLLIIDAMINMFLGAILAVYPRSIIESLGIPIVEQPFYASILGSVLFGIGVALLIQVKDTADGLGLKGAIAINMCGGICLALWLIFGKVIVPLRGQIIMWLLVLMLMGLSCFEFISQFRKKI